MLVEKTPIKKPIAVKRVLFIIGLLLDSLNE
jgi:hypothetical protein